MNRNALQKELTAMFPAKTMIRRSNSLNFACLHEFLSEEILVLVVFIVEATHMVRDTV